MHMIRSTFRTFVFAGLLATAAACTGKQVSAADAPVPQAIPAAKKLFISNGGSDSGLFPHPFSGDQNRAFNQFYGSLKASGHYELVSDPGEADLVLELRLTAPYGPSEPDKQKGASDPLPMFRLEIFDRKTHYILWTITETIHLAMKQTTHDRNFDEALEAIAKQFEQLSGRPATATP